MITFNALWEFGEKCQRLEFQRKKNASQNNISGVFTGGKGHMHSEGIKNHKREGSQKTGEEKKEEIRPQKAVWTM